MDRKKALGIIDKVKGIYCSASGGMEGLELFVYSSSNGDSEYLIKVYEFILKRNSNANSRIFGLEGGVVNEILKEVFKIPNTPHR